MTDESGDSELLRRYAASRDGAAFALLARRHLDLVYSAAARRVGDRHLAEDVTQAVFMILARKPNSAARSGSPSAWLLTTVRYAAANALRIERRRRLHEAAAAAQSAASDAGACSANPSDVLVWREVAGRLDDAVLALPAADRRAVLLRYFEQRPIRDVASALNVTETAAKVRLSRAVEKLRRRLNRRGASLAPAGAAALTTLRAAHAVSAAPPALLGPVCAAAAAAETVAAGAAASAIAKGTLTMMTWTKLKAVAAVMAVASVVGTGTAVTVSRGTANAQDRAAAAAQGGGAAVVREKAAARVKFAEQVLLHLNARAEAGEAMTPSFVELKSVSLRRLAEARIDAASDRGAQIKAAEEYVRDMRAVADLIQKRFDAGVDVSRVQVAQGQYQLVDAEYLLAKLQARQ